MAETAKDLNREFAERFIAQRCITDGEIKAEIVRIDQRHAELLKNLADKATLLKQELADYKETVRAKHEEMNEVRRQITSERGQFEIREHADAQVNAVNDKISRGLDVMNERMTRIENAYSGLNGRLLGLGMGLTVLMVLIEMVFKFWPGKG